LNLPITRSTAICRRNFAANSGATRYERAGVPVLNPWSTEICLIRSWSGPSHRWPKFLDSQSTITPASTISSVKTLKTTRNNDNLVSMTRIAKSKMTKTAKPPRRTRDRQPGRWLLQDAKARFSELVRRVRSEGPQHVTVHGRDEVVVIAAEEFRRLKGDLTGEALIAAMQASPYRDIDIEPRRAPMPVRGVAL
jgi:prevent-host-death family protein